MVGACSSVWIHSILFVFLCTIASAQVDSNSLNKERGTLDSLLRLNDVSKEKRKEYVLAYENYYLRSEKRYAQTEYPFDTFELQNLLDLLFEIDQKEKALDIITTRLSKAEKGKKKNPAIYLVTLEMYARVLAKTEQYERAQKIIEQQLLPFVKEKFPADEKRITMDLQNLLGAICEKSGDLGKAELHYRKAIEHLKALPQSSQWTQYQLLTKLLIAQGRYAEAAQLYREDVERMKKSGSKTEYHLQLLKLLDVYETLGLGAPQFEILIESYKMAEDDRDKSQRLSRIADFLLDQGYPAISVDSMYTKALTLAEKSTAGEGTFRLLLIARSSYKLATVKYLLGKYPEARALVDKSINAYNELGQLSKSDYYAEEAADVILLKVDISPGSNGAIQNIDEALLNLEKKSGKFNGSYYNLLEKKIDLLLSDDKRDEAKLLVKDLGNVLTRIDFETPSTRVDYFKSLAERYDLTGDFERARDFYKVIIDVTRESIERNLAGLSEAEFNEFYESKKRIFQSFTRFAIRNQERMPELNAIVYDNLLLLKGISFRTEQKLLEVASKQTDPVFKKKMASWRIKKDSINVLIRARSTEQQVSKLRRELQALERELSQTSEYARNVFSKVSWTTVRDNLLPGECAVEIIKTSEGFASRGLPVYVALVVDRDTKDHPRMITLSTDRGIENRNLKYYNNSIQTFSSDAKSYELYWKPLETALAGKNKVYLSADGVYHLINLNTLFNPSSNKYLIDEKQIKRLNSTAGVLSVSREKGNLPSTAVLFGNPNFNDAPLDTANSNASRFISNGKIVSLPGTAVEIEMIHKTLTSKNVSTVAYTTIEATEQMLKQVQSPGVLHIATHGFFLKEDELPSNFLGIEKRYLSNPLLRSGLLFSGSQASFTNPGDSGAEDGVITAQEASLLNLSQTQLVVLSACQTGLGELQSGEGVYGLQRSFQIAGARSVVISLWKVSDEATMQLMSSFYKHWDKSTTAEEAFTKAQYDLRQKYPEPYYWGAFIYVGM